MKDLALAEMEHAIQEMEAASYDGVFIWKIADFARKRQEAVAGRSPAIFSSGRESHRWEHPGGGGVQSGGQGTLKEAVPVSCTASSPTVSCFRPSALLGQPSTPASTATRCACGSTSMGMAPGGAPTCLSSSW